MLILGVYMKKEEIKIYCDELDENEIAWSLPRKLKNYVIGTFYEDKSLSLCEITMTDGRVLILKPE